MDAAAALRQAIEFEERSAEFYRRHADETESPVLRAVLTHLAELEVQHVASVRRTFGAGDAAPEVEALPGPEDTSGGLDPQLEAMLTQASEALRCGSRAEMGVYRTALQFERKAADFYRRAAAEHPSLRRVFTTLALVETLHVGVMERLLGAE